MHSSKAHQEWNQSSRSKSRSESPGKQEQWCSEQLGVHIGGVLQHGDTGDTGQGFLVKKPQKI